MRFYAISDAPISSSDVVFREAFVGKIIGAIFIYAAFATLVAFAWMQRSIILSVSALFCSLFVWLMTITARRAMGPASWLVRCRQGSLLIKYRSYMNCKQPAGDLVVVEFPYSEIESVGSVQERRIQPMYKKASVEQTRIQSLELKLRGINFQELEGKLQDERRLPAEGGEFLTYPVSTSEGNMLRVTWSGNSSRVTPGLSKAVDWIVKNGGVNLREPHVEMNDLLKKPEDRAGQEEAIRKLLNSGDKMRAITLAQDYYGYSLTDAVKFVDGLSNKTG